jgi:AcrR family transcriptional regulator
MARPKDDSKIDVIFEATLKIVLKTGFNGLKMADVAKAAGLATGTLYIYFKNKEVLINELFLSLKTAKTHRLLAVYNAKDSFEVNFRNLWFNYLELSLNEPERMLFIEQFAHTSLLTKKTKALGDELLKPLEEFLQQGIQQKKVRKLPIPLLLSQLMGPIYEIVKLQMDKKIVMNKNMKEGLYEIALRGISI